MRYAQWMLVGLILITAGCDGDGGRIAPANLRTPGNVICTTQCRKSNDYCAESCGLDYRACVSDAQAKGQRLYELYATQKHATGQGVDRKPSDFEDRAACDKERAACRTGCDSHYSSCYTSCNG